MSQSYIKHQIKLFIFPFGHLILTKQQKNKPVGYQINLSILHLKYCEVLWWGKYVLEDNNDVS